MKVSEVPVFGNLSNVNVVFMGNTVACPFAAELMAEQGARTICLENSKRPDLARMGDAPYGFLTEHRNQLALSLDVASEEGKKVFLDLMKQTDIFLEGNKGGTFAKWGLSDEVLWEANPQLVIVHVSGFGQTGDPAYVNRPSYDAIGQAFGGYVFLNGEAGREGLQAKPYTGDYFSALFACWSALAALNGARATGKGESIDVTQFESMWKCQYDYPMFYFRDDIVKTRNGNDDPIWAGVGSYQCGDGEAVMLSLAGFGPLSGCMKAIGYEDPEFDLKTTPALSRKDEVAMRFDAAIHQFCLEHTAAEVDKLFMEYNVPCSRVYNVQTIQDNSHVQARELFTEWEDPRIGTAKGVAPIPKMSNRPGEIWRAAPDWGEDNDDILSELGYDEEKIAELKAAGVVGASLPNGGFFGLK